MTRFLFEAYPRGADANNAPMSGAKMYVYEAGTTTPVTVYSDIANTIPHAHPIVADASGVWPQIYLPNGTYKVVIASAADVVIQTIDNVYQIDDAGETVVDDTAALIADTSLYYGAGLGGVAEGDYVRTRTGRLFIVADENATDAHAETAGGVKLYETGFSYSSFSNFEAAIDRGDFSGVWNGSPVEVAGTTYVKDDRQTFIPGLPGWRYPWQVQKHLLSSDWQPLDDQVTRMRATIDSIAARHPDLTHAHILGDLVTEGEMNPADDQPAWGHSEFLADWRTRLPVPLSNAYFLPGNHDQNGGRMVSDWTGAWTLDSYRKWIGPEYYYTVQGNLLWLYLGDMGGSGGGTITDAVAEWAGNVLRRNRDKNIIIGIHQPLSGCYQAKTEVADPDAVQAKSARITDVLDEIAAGADNVVAVLFGHSGSNYQFNDETHHGTRHLQIGMHLPQNVAAGDRNDHYYVMDMQHGASSIAVTQWDATADTELTTKTLTLAYPLQLGPEVRRYMGEDRPAEYPPCVSLPIDAYRIQDGSDFDPPQALSDAIALMKLGAVDRGIDSDPAGVPIGIRIDVPGEPATTDGVDDTASRGSIIGSAWEIWKRTGGTASAPEVSKFTRVYNGSALVTSNVSGPTGVHVGHDGTTTDHPGNAGYTGVSIGSDGYVSAHRANAMCAFWSRETDGDIMEFNKVAARAGSISISGATASYNTTSDERLKSDLRDFDGLAVIRELSVYDYAWRADGSRAKGVLAQEAHEVAPHAVRVGGEDPDRDPWSVDYSKLVPDLIRAVQQLEERIKELEG